jgi:small subunit ribosomal protein S16
VVMNMERVQHWLSQGAQPTDRIARMLEAAGARPKAVRNNPNAAKPGKAMTERAAKKAARAAEPAAE